MADAPENVHCTPSMVPQHDDCYKCSLNKLKVEFSIIPHGSWKKEQSLLVTMWSLFYLSSKECLMFKKNLCIYFTLIKNSL